MLVRNNIKKGWGVSADLIVGGCGPATMRDGCFVETWMGWVVAAAMAVPAATADVSGLGGRSKRFGV